MVQCSLFKEIWKNKFVLIRSFFNERRSFFYTTTIECYYYPALFPFNAISFGFMQSPNVTAFIQFIQFEKRYSPNTILAYQKDLEQFTNFAHDLQQLTDIDQAKHIVIRSWIVALMEEKITARSINRKISTLKSYYKFILRKGVITKNPMEKVISPKTSKRLPVFVEQKNMETLLNDIPFEEGFAGERDKLIIELLYATGMRRSELLGIKESDIDSYGGQIKVIGKGKKERIIPLNNKLIRCINHYRETKAAICSGEHLICDETGKALAAGKVYTIVKKNLSMVTTVDKRSPHVLRHSFATHLLNNGAEINAVKELLGHANLAATQVYTHNTIEKLKDVYKQAHPKG